MSYKEKQAKARQLAIDWQLNFANQNHTWAYLSWWYLRFERIGRKYGLLREFRENGIL